MREDAALTVVSTATATTDSPRFLSARANRMRQEVRWRLRSRKDAPRYSVLPVASEARVAAHSRFTNAQSRIRPFFVAGCLRHKKTLGATGHPASFNF